MRIQAASQRLASKPQELSAVKPHARAPAPPSPKTQVTWGRGRLRACAPQADGDYPAPAQLGLGPRWEPRFRLRRQPGLGLAPGPPEMALRPSKGDGSAGRWDRGPGKAGTEDGGLGRRLRAAWPGPEGGGGGG